MCPQYSRDGLRGNVCFKNEFLFAKFKTKNTNKQKDLKDWCLCVVTKANVCVAHRHSARVFRPRRRADERIFQFFILGLRVNMCLISCFLSANTIKQL